MFKLEDLYEKLEVERGCKLKKKVWNICDNLYELVFGRLWYYFFGLLIVLSIVCIVVEIILFFCDEKYFC